MSCFHPTLIYCSWNTQTQKYETHLSYSDEVFTDYLQKVNSNAPWKKHPFDKVVKRPCGKCLGCLDDRASEWSKRVQLEDSLNPGHTYFLTLTYDDLFLPITEVRYKIDLETGEFYDESLPSDIFIPTLCRDDLQLFKKNLRSFFPDSDLRFFGCGEYGSTYGRSHYHLIVFNLDFSLLDKRFYKDAQFVRYGSESSDLFTCKFLNDRWKPRKQDPLNRPHSPMGQVWISPYHPNRGRYVAKYMLKSYYENEGDLLYEDTREKPFLDTPKRPGLARQFFDEHKNSLLDFDNVILSGDNGAFTTSLPNYFYSIARADESLSQKVIKNKLRRNELSILNIDNSRDTDLDFANYRKILEDRATRHYKHRKEL